MCGELVLRAVARATMAARECRVDSGAAWALHIIEAPAMVARTRACEALRDMCHDYATFSPASQGPEWLARLQACSAGAVAIATLARQQLLAGGRS